MNIGIAGAGLLGRLVALCLCAKGYQVTLIDSDKKQGNRSCAMAASGMLALHAELERADIQIERLGRRSLDAWPSILASLSEPVYYRQSGSIATAHPTDQPDLERYIKRIESVLGGGHEITPLDEAGLGALEPEIPGFPSAYYFPQEAQLDNQQLMRALWKTLEQKKVGWHEEERVEQVSAGKLITVNKTYCFDHVFDCRGLGAAQDLKDLRPVRGELLWLHAPQVHITRPIRLMHPRYSLYVVPRPGRIYLLGASEIESCDDGPISVRTTMELLSAAYSLHRGFIEARVLKSVVGCRPAFPDNLPRVDCQRGLTCINGLYRHGFLIAPALVSDAVATLN